MSTKSRGAGFETRFMHKGAQYSATFKTKEAGEAWELEQRARLLKGLPVIAPLGSGATAPDAGLLTMQQLYQKALKVGWKGKDDRQRHNGQLYVDWCGPETLALDGMTEDRICEYIDYREDEIGNAGSTANRHISAISVMATVAVHLGVIPRRPLLPWRKGGSPRLRFYTHEEETQIEGLCVKWGLHDYADLFVFLAETGARLGEAENLVWSEIRPTTISFLNTKNGTDRTIGITPACAAALARLKARHHNSLDGPFGWLKRTQLRTVWDRLRGELDWMGPDTVVHTFRHTCASRLAQSGKADIYRIQRWMGHKSTATTMRYAKLIPKTMEDLANALAAYNATENPSVQPPPPQSPDQPPRSPSLH